jgi:hypothetical protein
MPDLLDDAERRFADYFGYPRPRSTAELDATSKRMLHQWRDERALQAEAQRQKATMRKAQAMKDEAIKKAEAEEEEPLDE